MTEGVGNNQGTSHKGACILHSPHVHTPANVPGSGIHALVVHGCPDQAAVHPEADCTGRNSGNIGHGVLLTT